jgi:hypothetical protein
MAGHEQDELGDGAVHPLDAIETVAGSYGWASDRSGEDEVTVAVPGSWCEYQLRSVWRDDEQVLQTVCLLDAKVADAKRASVFETLSLINERLWVGHFELWSSDGTLLYRHAQLVDGEAGMTAASAELLMQTAIAECERFYPVFQFVLWAGKKPLDALEAAMLEPMGEA